jgi:Raf kinase inhibitor-like YbhB/YbcL family protein
MTVLWAAIRTRFSMASILSSRRRRQRARSAAVCSGFERRARRPTKGSTKGSMPGRTALLVLFSCASCGSCKSSAGHPSTPYGVPLASLTVTSKSFSPNGAVPVDYTCAGADRSPGLSWSAPPAGTKSVCIVMDDPDASGGDFTHWLALDLRPDAVSIPEAIDVADLGGTIGINGFDRAGYSGPCPPRMELHHYVFRVFALDATIGAGPSANRDAVDAAMNGHVLAEGALVGTFSR